MMGRSPTIANGLGLSATSGRNRVPKPPANTKRSAFRGALGDGYRNSSLVANVRCCAIPRRKMSWRTFSPSTSGISRFPDSRAIPESASSPSSGLHVNGVLLQTSMTGVVNGVWRRSARRKSESVRMPKSLRSSSTTHETSSPDRLMLAAASASVSVGLMHAVRKFLENKGLPFIPGSLHGEVMKPFDVEFS